MSNEEFISINKVAEAKGLKSNRSLRLEINKPESKYVAREVKVNGGTSYEILYSSLEPEIQQKLRENNTKYFVRNTDLKTNTFNVFVDEHSYKFLSKSTLYGNEIIISNVGDVGSVFLCPKLDLPMTLGNNIIMLRPKDNRLTYYLYIWFKWSYGQNLIQGIKGGSAQPKFNKTDFKSLPIIIPQGKLLDKFSDIMTPIFNSIEKNNKENKVLTQLRDTLLPKLMSGEIDVSNVDISTDKLSFIIQISLIFYKLGNKSCFYINYYVFVIKICNYFTFE